eukprot:TRINITY_DN52885_c0_g1_i1.p1 TRINITY_DN52885_c0_g1~~TRINITY_DN52885_c0_g1_i1.p1  ORF type:complete len:122 (-),score=36.81 TRINITY_DN52885_c0_g1_i1:11-376(-)
MSAQIAVLESQAAERQEAGTDKQGLLHRLEELQCGEAEYQIKIATLSEQARQKEQELRSLEHKFEEQQGAWNLRAAELVDERDAVTGQLERLQIESARGDGADAAQVQHCLLYTSPSPRDS